jgi:aryl-alcohol dehydrogenase-like predicted oxidoreductase
MRYRKLGRTDIEVSVICQGCWSIVTEDTTWGGNALEDSIAAIRASLDAGVNFFDTAEGYGREGESEEILAKALAGRRKDVVIATKVSPGRFAPRKLKAACDDSLRRLATDYIDLYQLHWPNPDVPIADTLEVMAQLRQAGKIRAIGVSNFGLSYMTELLEAGRAESNQLPYSLLWRPIEHEVQGWCAANDISILCYGSLCQGLLTGKFASADQVPVGRARTRLFSKDRPQSRHGQSGCEAEAFKAIAEIRHICKSINQPMAHASLAWLLAQQGVTSAIVGGRNPQQARDNAGAADLELSADVLEALSQAAEKVKNRIGTNCDLWQSNSRMERPQGSDPKGTR